MTFYHRTSEKAAARILARGFQDATTTLSGLKLTGVWLSDIPLDMNEGATRDESLLQVVLRLPSRELKRWELIEEGKPYREWCIPAAEVVNRGTISAVVQEA